MRAGVLKVFEETAPVTAVRGNVDDQASEDELPTTRLLDIKGWQILIIHILPQTDSPVRSQQRHQVLPTMSLWLGCSCRMLHAVGCVEEGAVLHAGMDSYSG